MSESTDDHERQLRRIWQKAHDKGWVLVEKQGHPDRWELVDETDPRDAKTWDVGVTLDEAEKFVDGDEETLRLRGRHTSND